MAKIQSIKKSHNDSFARVEGVATIEFENTISIDTAKQLIAKNLAIEDVNLVQILDLSTKYGKQIAEAEFEAYDNAEAMNKVEVIPKKVRAKMAEEAKKAYEEKKKQIEEQKKAEEEAKAAAEAEKSVETKEETTETKEEVLEAKEE